jgi:hypothetical protein
MYLERRSQFCHAKIGVEERGHLEFESATVLFSGIVVVRIEEQVFKSVLKSV